MVHKEAKSDEFLEIDEAFWWVCPRSVRNRPTGTTAVTPISDYGMMSTVNTENNYFMKLKKKKNSESQTNIGKT